MDIVYSLAHLTICASRAFGASEGFLQNQAATAIRWGSWDRKNSQTKDIFLRWRRNGQDMENILADQPLGSRGWAVQERLLSPRKVFFTSQQMVWQCPSLHCFEDDMEVSPGGGRGFSTSVLLEEDLDQNGWGGVVFDYTQCKLTKFTDRLSALSGIAKVFGDALKDEYYAGHFYRTLPQSMIWRTLPKGMDSRPDGTPYSAPSWSWASVHAGVQLLYRSSQDEVLCKVLDLQISTTSKDNPWGQVIDGWIELEAPVVPVRIQRDSRKGYLALLKMKEAEFQMYGNEWSTNPDVMWLDRNEDAIDAVAVFFAGHDLARPTYEGLLITPSASREGTFVRIGGFTDCAILPNIPRPGVSFERKHCKTMSEVDQVRFQRVKIV